MAPPGPHATLTTPFSIRADAPNTSPLARHLMSLISIKRSNLCVSADVHTTAELLDVAEAVGDYICILKTHADIIDDWSRNTIARLQEVATRKHFLLFEDRKFGDIGNTLQLQYTRGPLQVASWAHLTNAHLFPGPSIVPTLQSAAQAHLTSLNQSVSTEITAGTLPLSLEDGDSSALRNPVNATITTTMSSDPATKLSASTGATPTHPSAPAPGPAASPPDPTTNTNNNNQVLFSHRRNPSGSAFATTTITQSSEPLSPRPPPSLLKTVSQGEEAGAGAATPHDPAPLLAELGPPPHARGLLLLAQMSSEGNLLTSEYTAQCVATARAHGDFVLGFVSQRSLNALEGDNFLSLAPGVGLPPEGVVGGSAPGAMGDGKGQRWRDPKEVVGRDGIDVVIVGRGVLNAEERGKEAERYRRRAWEAYEERIRRRC